MARGGRSLARTQSTAPHGLPCSPGPGGEHHADADAPRPGACRPRRGAGAHRPLAAARGHPGQRPRAVGPATARRRQLAAHDDAGHAGLRRVVHGRPVGLRAPGRTGMQAAARRRRPRAAAAPAAALAGAGAAPRTGQPAVGVARLPRRRAALRHRQRPVRRDARLAHGLFLRLLAARRHAGTGTGAQTGTDRPQARTATGRTAARRGLRLGRAGRICGAPPTPSTTAARCRWRRA